MRFFNTHILYSYTHTLEVVGRCTHLYIVYEDFLFKTKEIIYTIVSGKNEGERIPCYICRQRF